MSYVKVSLGFSRLSDHGLESAALEIMTAMTGNAHYPTPPVTMAELGASIEAFSAAMAKQWDGGPPATSAKNDKRAALSTSLFDLGCYVQSACNHDMTVLLGSGFKAARTTHTGGPLDMPVMVGVHNDGPGALVMRAKPVKRARAYEVRYSLAAAVEPVMWQVAVFTQARTMRIGNLVAGTNYRLQARAIGGSTGQSNWTDPVLHMSL